MKTGILAAIVITLSIASQAGASILSASSEAVREPSANVVESWNATALQNDLNASLLDAAEASTQAGPLASRRAPVSGGFMVIDGVSSGATYAPLNGSAALDGLFQTERKSDRFVAGAWDPRDPGISAGSRRGGHGGRHDRHRDRDRDRWRDRHNPYATPEPSTLVLFASGLLLLGAYVGLRRRDATNG